MARTKRCLAGSLLLVLLGATLHGVGVWGSPGANDEVFTFHYRTYTEVMNYFKDLEKNYPDLVETWISQEVFPAVNPSKKPWGRCDGHPCQTLIVRLANKQTLTDSTPEVFFSGALHGDEVIGPLTVTELAGFLCRKYRAGDADVRRLLDSRSTWITPMTNAEGFANRHREELGVDPNRDFGYEQDPKKCMKTQTARTVNELFRRHLFQYMITFHGGTTSITYEWGSRNHAVGSRSTESPDDRAFSEVGSAIRSAAGKRHGGSWWYPLGRITDLVYWVDGGMEDWSYGAGFEDSPEPITVCKPNSFGGYPASQTRYRKGSIATLVYLVETDDAKRPAENLLGSSSDVQEASISQGEVARNLKMCLKIIELAKPEVVLTEPWTLPRLTPNQEVTVRLFGFGCLYLNVARLLLLPVESVSGCDTLRPPTGNAEWQPASWRALLSQALLIAQMESPTKCRGLAIWEKRDNTVQLRGHVPPKTPNGRFCVVVAAEFDQAWAQQAHPDPAVPPRSHAVRTRIDDFYEAVANEGPMHVREFKTKIFGVSSFSLVVGAEPASPASPLAPVEEQQEQNSISAVQQPVVAPPMTQLEASAAPEGMDHVNGEQPEEQPGASWLDAGGIHWLALAAAAVALLGLVAHRAFRSPPRSVTAHGASAIGRATNESVAMEAGSAIAPAE